MINYDLLKNEAKKSDWILIHTGLKDLIPMQKDLFAGMNMSISPLLPNPMTL